MNFVLWICMIFDDLILELSKLFLCIMQQIGSLIKCSIVYHLAWIMFNHKKWLVKLKHIMTLGYCCLYDIWYTSILVCASVVNFQMQNQFSLDPSRNFIIIGSQTFAHPVYCTPLKQLSCFCIHRRMQQFENWPDLYSSGFYHHASILSDIELYSSVFSIFSN